MLGKCGRLRMNLLLHEEHTKLKSLVHHAECVWFKIFNLLSHQLNSMKGTQLFSTAMPNFHFPTISNNNMAEAYICDLRGTIVPNTVKSRNEYSNGSWKNMQLLWRLYTYIYFFLECKVTCTFFIFLSDGDDYCTIKLKVAATGIQAWGKLRQWHTWQLFTCPATQHCVPTFPYFLCGLPFFKDLNKKKCCKRKLISKRLCLYKHIIYPLIVLSLPSVYHCCCLLLLGYRRISL